MHYTSLSSLATLSAQAALVAGLLSCGTTSPFVWANDYTVVADPPADARIIQPGDKVIVHVRGQDALSGEFVVAGDGRYRQPRLGLVEVGGFTVREASKRLKTRLEGWLDASLIEFSVEHKPPAVSVIGSVRRSGRYEIQNGTTVLTILAEAGGLDDFADRDSIFVLRGNDTPTRIRFRYRDLLDGRLAGFELRGGDVVVVE